MNRSQLLLDIEHDLNLISKRLHALEDHFEDDGIVAQLTASVYALATKHETAHDLLREVVNRHPQIGADWYERAQRELGHAD